MRQRFAIITGWTIIILAFCVFISNAFPPTPPTVNITGNAATATALASNPTDCGANAVATAIDASGNLTCSQSVGTIATQNSDNATITGGSLSGTTIAPKIITKSGSGSLSAAECTGTIIHLYGQTLDTTLELPAAFANGNFVFVVDATVEKYVRLDPTGSEVQSLDGTDLTAGYYVGLTTAVKGAVIQYIAIRTGASTYQWAAFTVTSAWTPQS